MTFATQDARHAPSPMRLGWRGWMSAGRRVIDTFGREKLSLIAAGCAFYSLLALAPALAALGALYGLFADPADIARHLEALDEVAPPAAYGLIADQAESLRSAGRTALGWASLGAVALAVFSARTGVRALMTGVALAYRQPESRGFFRDMAATYLLTLVLMLLGVVALGAVVVAPALFGLLPLGATVETIGGLARWPIGLAAAAFGLGALYRYAPPRRNARPLWVAPGAVAGIVVWLIGSVLFSIYLARFGNYNETYGALGAVAALLMWFWVSANAALLGATLNAELELETQADTTVGPPRPRGDRGAFVADNLPDG